jgi:hypothetical protein
MYLIGTTGNFSNRSHRSVQHYCIAGPDAQRAKAVRQLVHRIHSKLSLIRSQPFDSNNAIEFLVAHFKSKKL